MKLIISQTSEYWKHCGPKEKRFIFSHEYIDYEITVEQLSERQITISSPGINTMRSFLYVFYSIETLLMLFDGQFYSVNRAFDNSQEITHSFRRRTLPSYKSADFMIGAENVLIDYECVLSAELLTHWIALREELDLIHNMMLYCVSSVQMPVDMKCAFMIETFSGLSELVNEQKKDFVLPTVHGKESRLKKYLIAIIECYGQDIFCEECKRNKDKFSQILKDSRNRIAHTKSKQGCLYLDGEESLLYLSKLSILYRVILFDLLGISKEFYDKKLQRRTDALNHHKDIVNGFLEKL